MTIPSYPHGKPKPRLSGSTALGASWSEPDERPRAAERRDQREPLCVPVVRCEIVHRFPPSRLRYLCSTARCLCNHGHTRFLANLLGMLRGAEGG
jgi:hypothetical protein